MKTLNHFLKRTSAGGLIALAALALTTGAALAAEDQWQTDFKSAQTEAAKQHKQILLDFTGSDWCPWCVKMDKEVFSKPTFSDFAAKNLVLVKLDFPREKEIPPAERTQNEGLAKKFNVNGFPTYVLLDASGKELKRQEGYLEGGPSAFIEWAGQGTAKN